jgi:ribose transport system ATP-binding protein
VAPYLKQVDLDMDPHTILGTLKVAQKQMVMIAKALCKQARIIVLDEPTAMLNEKEVATFFDIIAKLKKQGITIIYISHRMEEIYKIGDHITVLKDGAYVGTYPVSEINIEELVVKMVGRELKDVYPTKNRKFGEPILEVKNLSNDRIHDISFTLRKGEVLGIAGLVGAGRTEILRAIFAADPKYQGTLVLKGREIDVSTPADSIRRGIGYLPEDKRLQGVINCLSVKDNITLIYSQLTANHGFLRKKDDDAITGRYMKELSIKASSPNQLVGELSGGNQQKVVVSKWLSIAPNVILLDEPTQGIDVGAKAEIYQLIDNLAREGMGVVLVSSDLIEIINLSDRIIVMRDGRMAGELSDDEITEYNVMLYAMGVKKNEAI